MFIYKKCDKTVEEKAIESTIQGNEFIAFENTLKIYIYFICEPITPLEYFVTVVY